jgi:hypothetical protein
MAQSLHHSSQHITAPHASHTRGARARAASGRIGVARDRRRKRHARRARRCRATITYRARVHACDGGDYRRRRWRASNPGTRPATRRRHTEISRVDAQTWNVVGLVRQNVQLLSQMPVILPTHTPRYRVHDRDHRHTLVRDRDWARSPCWCTSTPAGQATSDTQRLNPQYNACTTWRAPLAQRTG